MTIEQLEAAALELPRQDRARLAQRILASLDGDSTLEAAWYDVAEKRLAKLEAGEGNEIPAKEVFAALGLDREK